VFVQVPMNMKHQTFATLRDKLIKIGAKVVTYSRYAVFQMAEVAVSGELFRLILNCIRWPHAEDSLALS
jgi:hypothetical protein